MPYDTRKHNGKFSRNQQKYAIGLLISVFSLTGRKCDESPLIFIPV